VAKAALALAEALNQEAKALQDAGATFVQFNEPAITQHKEDIAEFANVAQRLVAGLNVETALYTYFGDVEGIYEQLLELPFDDRLTLHERQERRVIRRRPRKLGLVRRCGRLLETRSRSRSASGHQRAFRRTRSTVAEPRLSSAARGRREAAPDGRRCVRRRRCWYDEERWSAGR
jgi:hypothetical protein